MVLNREMQTGKKKEKALFAQLADVLEKEFSARSVDSFATTLDDLMERFKISRGTAKRVLLELQQRGVVYSRVGAGSFVAPPRRKNLILIVFDLHHGLATQDSFNETFLVRALIQCNIHYSNYTVAPMDFNTFEQHIDHLEMMNPGLKGVVILRRISPYLTLISKLQARGIPCAFYGSSAYAADLKKVDYLVYNERRIIEIALAALQERQCRAPGFVGDLSFAVYQERLKQLRAVLSGFGMSYSAKRMLDTRTVDWNDRLTLRKYFCECDCVITADDCNALRFAYLARDLGFMIPRDLAFIGINDMPYLNNIQPRITSVSLDSGDDAARMIDLLIARIEKGTRFTGYTDSRLVRRDTV